MKRRILGGTGMSVSEFALGAMMFGAMGNTDRDESVRMIHRALDAGLNSSTRRTCTPVASRRTAHPALSDKRLRRR